MRRFADAQLWHSMWWPFSSILAPDQAICAYEIHTEYNAGRRYGNVCRRGYEIAG